MSSSSAAPRFLAGCKDVVEQARGTTGCLQFSITANLLDPARIVILERWEFQETAEKFRGSGPSDEQTTVITSASVTEYDVTGARPLT